MLSRLLHRVTGYGDSFSALFFGVRPAPQYSEAPPDIVAKKWQRPCYCISSRHIFSILKTSNIIMVPPKSEVMSMEMNMVNSFGEDDFLG